MKHFLTFLLFITSLTTFGQYTKLRDNGVLVTSEYYISNSPGNMISNSRMVIQQKDSTWYKFFYPDLQMSFYGSTRDDGVPASVLWVDNSGWIKRSPFPTIPTNNNQLTNGANYAVAGGLNSQFIKGDGTYGTSVNGTVTSVGLSSTDFNVTGTPITSSGTLVANLNTSGVTAGTYDGITVNNKGIVTGATATNTLTYGPSGAITNRIKKWEGAIAGTTASGQSIDISSAGFSTVLSIQVTAKENVATVKGALVSIKSNTTSAVVVNIYSSKNTGVLIGGNIEGLEFHTAPANVTLFVTVTGY
jgi:hypothetical protein